MHLITPIQSKGFRFLAPQMTELVWEHYLKREKSWGYKDQNTFISNITPAFIHLVCTALLWALLSYQKDGNRQDMPRFDETHVIRKLV